MTRFRMLVPILDTFMRKPPEGPIHLAEMKLMQPDNSVTNFYLSALSRVYQGGITGCSGLSWDPSTYF